MAVPVMRNVLQALNYLAE
jgi:serine/threonine protein kinase